MTEEEWLKCRDVYDMFECLQPAPSARKTRLLGCACVRWAWEWGHNETPPEAVRFVEAFADGLATNEDLSRVAGEMGVIWREHDEPYRPYPRTCELTEALASPEDARAWLNDLNPFSSDLYIDEEPEWLKIVEFVRDVVGNPFRPVAPDPAWLTSDVLALARGIYEERAFDRMPILADALQDAGCTNEDVLSHCRDTQLTHVRGCWVVDLVLGKT
jgi:hypothetical protein